MKTVRFELKNYVNGSTGELNLYLNDENKETPLLLVVPGGGYGHISIRENLPVVDCFLKEDINVASLKYSVFPIHYPVQEYEINESINILRNFSKNIFVVGFSAGAHLSLLAYTDIKNKDLKGIITLYPVVSFLKNYHEGSRNHFLNYEINEINLNKYSVEKRITSSLSPALIFVGKNDKSVDPKNSILLHETLDKFNVKNKLTIYEDAPHGFALADETTLINNDKSLIKKEAQGRVLEAMNFINNLKI